ncbi:MAG: (1-_4)-alpha-D-glucan 1-alpha-D-glucosylmutase [Pseudonocardiales bacterium]|nr:(1->4)-alpha-D-glucan 1-alpha-D-glucosylmutase [Pseudonocardiales bacterium]
MAVPSSTVRLQVRASFDLDAAAAVCGYLASLGTGAAYLSPLLPSAAGSEHGYDVVAFDTVDAARGGSRGWSHLVTAAREHGLDVVVDIVPNHTGVADAAENPAWWDVLRLGQASPYASWFDIDWTPGKVLLPVLGDEFSPDELTIQDGELRYYEHRFPISPGSGPLAGESATDVLERQHYRLANFRLADTEQNYRRFFAVTTLAGLRVEDPAVFDATHAEILRWVERDGIAGLRVDHPDGLVDPSEYLARLRELAGPDSWITVEKILEPGEELPPEWPVDGTTGYDALTEVNNAFVDPDGEAPLDALYRELTGDDAGLHEHVRRGKELAVNTILRAEVNRLARLVPGVERADEALAALLVAFPVYRSYLPIGAEHLAQAMETARSARPDLADAIASLTPRLTDPADELCRRFQQQSGAVMAKGVEDTAYYRYTRFIALNEVGGDPSTFGTPPDHFHAAQARRQEVAPRSMTTLSTHDTKRGEDVRARLAVLAEVHDEWAELVRRLMRRAPIRDPSFAYLLWQTFAGAGLVERERMHAYAEKAMREAAQSTTWIDPDARFEATVQAAVDAAYDDAAVGEPLRAFVARITPYGWSNSLGQKLVQLTMPGVPDVYQGTEFWDDSLVDPDNRRSVDFSVRAAALAELDFAADAPPVDASGRAKLWVVSRALRLRRDEPQRFGSYTPLQADGRAADHVLAFDRGGALTVATRLPVRLERAGGWQDTTLELGAGATDVLTGRAFGAKAEVADVLSRYPVALLAR